MNSYLTHRKTKATAFICALVICLISLAPAVPARAASNEEETFFFLTDTLGYSGAAACGIMANIRAESNFYPGAYNSSGAYGLCQWMGGRRGSLYGFCDSNGYDSDSLEGQLAFLDHEMKTRYPGVYNYLMSVDNTSEGAYDAAYHMCYYYEAPANRGGQSSRRGSMASGTFWPRYEIYTKDVWLDTADGRIYHYKDGTYHVGWLTLDDEIYYLDANGILRAGLFTADGRTYLADENGARLTGWQTIDDATYYFSPEDGSMQTGWIEVDGQTFFLADNGKLESVNTLADKTGVTEDDIARKAAEKENHEDETVNAPASDPLPLPDNINDVAESIQSAGSDSQTAAAVVASPGNDTAVNPDDFGGASTAMQGADMTPEEELITFGEN